MCVCLTKGESERGFESENKLCVCVCVSECGRKRERDGGGTSMTERQ